MADDTNRVQNLATVDSDLNSDGDATEAGEHAIAAANAVWTRPLQKHLPATGFAPDVITDRSDLPREMYLQTGGLRLEIPSLKLNIPVVGVPLRNGDWNLGWLGDQAGWLEGSAFPSWNGNSLLTGHVYLSNGLPGPFVSLHKLAYWDKIIIPPMGRNIFS